MEWYAVDMLLPGKLSACPLGDLLGKLHRQRTTGVLELWELCATGAVLPGQRHRIHFASGLVADVETRSAVPPLGEILRRRGLLAREGVALLLRRLADGDGKPSGEILIETGVARDAVALGLRAQMQERLGALFAIQEAAVRFHTASRRRPGLAMTPLSPKEFLHGRPRARDRGAPPRSRTRSRPEPTERWEAPRQAQGAPIEQRARALALFGLDSRATSDEVRRAFRRLAARVHPDVQRGPNQTRTDGLPTFAELSRAYHLLID